MKNVEVECKIWNILWNNHLFLIYLFCNLSLKKFISVNAYAVWKDLLESSSIIIFHFVNKLVTINGHIEFSIDNFYFIIYKISLVIFNNINLMVKRRT